MAAINYRKIRDALGLRPASRSRSGKLYYRGEGRNVSERDFRGDGYEENGVADTYREVERLRRTDPDSAVDLAGTRTACGCSLKDVSPSYFVEVVQTAVNRKLRNRETGDALEQARDHRRALPPEYFATVVRKHVERCVGNGKEEDAMSTADEFFSLLPENLLQTTTRAYFAKMRRAGTPEAAFEHMWNYLNEDEFVELGRTAVEHHGRRRGDWVKAKEVAEQVPREYGVELFNRDELRGLIERSCFDRRVHERMTPEERDAILTLAEDLNLPQVRRDQLSALTHETDFLANGRRRRPANL